MAPGVLKMFSATTKTLSNHTIQKNTPVRYGTDWRVLPRRKACRRYDIGYLSMMASQKRLGFGCGLDLAQSVLGQGLDGYAGTGRIGGEVLCVYLIESGKVDIWLF